MEVIFHDQIFRGSIKIIPEINKVTGKRNTDLGILPKVHT